MGQSAPFGVYEEILNLVDELRPRGILAEAVGRALLCVPCVVHRYSLTAPRLSLVDVSRNRYGSGGATGAEMTRRP